MKFFVLLLLWPNELGVGAARSAQPVLQADDAQRGVQLLRRAQDAMGGAAKLSAVRDTTHVMEITLGPAAGGYKLTQVSRYAAPDQFRQEQETPFGKTVVYSDGKIGWITTPQGTMPLSTDMLAMVRGVLFRQPSSLMLSDRHPSRSVKAIGGNAVEVTSSDGQQVHIEFSPETGLPVRQSYVTVVASGSRGTRAELFSDWRDVNGLRFPFKAVQLEDGSRVLELNVSEYQVNTGLTATDLGKQ